jgi:hypothetical protein
MMLSKAEISQSINQSFNQSINQPTNQPTKQASKQAINQSVYIYISILTINMVNSRDRWRSCENPTKVSATPEASLALLLPIVMRGLKAGRALVALLVGDGHLNI